MLNTKKILIILLAASLLHTIKSEFKKPTIEELKNEFFSTCSFFPQKEKAAVLALKNLPEDPEDKKLIKNFEVFYK